MAKDDVRIVQVFPPRPKKSTSVEGPVKPYVPVRIGGKIAKLIGFKKTRTGESICEIVLLTDEGKGIARASITIKVESPIHRDELLKFVEVSINRAFW